MKSPYEYSALKLINNHIISSMCAMIYRPVGKKTRWCWTTRCWIGDIVTLIGATTSVALMSNFVSIMQVSNMFKWLF
jgi:hypothetical protein